MNSFPSSLSLYLRLLSLHWKPSLVLCDHEKRHAGLYGIVLTGGHSKRRARLFIEKACRFISQKKRRVTSDSNHSSDRRYSPVATVTLSSDRQSWHQHCPSLLPSRTADVGAAHRYYDSMVIVETGQLRPVATMKTTHVATVPLCSSVGIFCIFSNDSMWSILK
jgi:hypothetical protein